MNFNEHSNLKGLHAFLGASNYHWLNYDKEKLIEVYNNSLSKERGVILHDFASQCIMLNERLCEKNKTLNMYVNDAIGFKMKTEQILYYSDNCFGTADTISFKKNVLRIHDLKTGISPTSMLQLRIYAALFCLEYGYSPNDLDKIILRIYQNDDVSEEIAEPTDILYVMEKIKNFDKIINDIKMEG